MPIQLTADHTPLDSQEYERVYNNGGFVEVEVNGVPRVNGILAITRSIGDKSLRYVLSSTPDIIMINLDKELSSSRSSTNNDVNNNDNNCIKYARLLNSTTNNKLFLILGSDGLYETVSNEVL
jgi:serine/threonine protein phosphatase PrpC